MNERATHQWKTDLPSVHSVVKRAVGMAAVCCSFFMYSPLHSDDVATELTSTAEFDFSAFAGAESELLNTSETVSKEDSPSIEIVTTDALDLDVDGLVADAGESLTQGDGVTVELEAPGVTYEISEFVPEYLWEREGNPSVAELLSATVYLEESSGIYSKATDPERAIPISLERLSALPARRFDVSAVQAVMDALVKRFHDKGIVGVYIAPNYEDIDSDGVDMRPGGSKALRVTIRVPVLGEVHSVAQGNRIDENQRVDNPKHQKILDESPVAVGGFIIKDHLDNYIHYLNRHPGRQVHMTLAPSNGEKGEAKLDYVVSESRPWTAYAHVANTGSQGTSDWRETFGFRHNDLVGWDDIFVINYSTASFSKSHTVFASWDAPFLFPDLTDRIDLSRLRFKHHIVYSEFRATDLGIFQTSFRGKNFEFGGEGYYNIWQEGPRFIDVFTSGRYQNINVKNTVGPIVTTEGRELISVSALGARYERFTDEGNSTAEVSVETNVHPFASPSKARLQTLGRMNVSRFFFMIKGHATHSFYLDEMFDCDTRAHLMELAFRGQYAFGDRLIPQHKMVLGGQNTIRGYPEAFASGDDAYMSSAEYRFYIPRLMDADSSKQTRFMGRTFRWAPEYPGGRSDWDLALCAYTDMGYTHNARKTSFEFNNFFWSVGVGLEAMLCNNIRIRGDWAWALNRTRTAGSTVRGGDSEGHISAAFIY